MEFKMRAFKESEFLSTLNSFATMAGVTPTMTTIDRDGQETTITIQAGVAAKLTSEQLLELDSIH
jgi:hypothetical protein